VMARKLSHSLSVMLNMKYEGMCRGVTVNNWNILLVIKCIFHLHMPFYHGLFFSSCPMQGVLFSIPRLAIRSTGVIGGWRCELSVHG